MKIVLANDHAGVHLKTAVKTWLSEHKFEVIDLGTNSEDSVDYPDFAHKLAEEVETHEGSELGILICGSGNGVAMAANKHKGIRAALAWNPEIASLARQHNNANVLSLPARFISEKEAMAIVNSFLDAKFEGGRHERRVEERFENWRIWEFENEMMRQYVNVQMKKRISKKLSSNCDHQLTTIN